MSQPVTAAAAALPVEENEHQRERREREAALAALVELSDSFADLNREDSIWRSPDGWLVKVKLLRDVRGEREASAPGLFHVSGAIVGSDGKALKRDDDSPAVWTGRMTWSHEGHNPLMRPDKGRDLVRRQCALLTIQLEVARQLVDELDGFETLEGFAARKATEAAAVAAVAAGELQAEVDPAAAAYTNAVRED